MCLLTTLTPENATRSCSEKVSRMRSCKSKLTALISNILYRYRRKKHSQIKHSECSPIPQRIRHVGRSRRRPRRSEKKGIEKRIAQQRRPTGPHGRRRTRRPITLPPLGKWKQITKKAFDNLSLRPIFPDEPQRPSRLRERRRVPLTR